MTELERYKLAYTIAMDHLANFATTYKQAFDEVNDILNPPQEFEEVPVEVWALLNQKGEIYGTSCDEPNQPSDLCIKLTGVYKRPIPQKVERSVSVEAMIGDGTAYTKGAGIAVREGGRTQLVEFAEHPECYGKKGTLTFTWTE